MTMKTPGWRILASLTLAAAASGCALLRPNAFPPGTSLSEVRSSSARPTGEYGLPNGGTRLEFALGTFSKQTYMLDFDASGTLVASQQVLTEANLSTITPGMSEEAVRANFGRPVKVDFIGRQHLKVWSYRYAGGDCEWFQVSLSDGGSVLGANKAWDPVCDGPSHQR